LQVTPAMNLLTRELALTARSHGAKLITSNRAGFELIREYREFELEVW